MTNVHHSSAIDNRIEFVGIVGKAGIRRTPYGLSIDVADNRVRPCLWVDVIPDDPFILKKLSCGDVVDVVGEIMLDGSRPLVRATVTILQKQRRKVDG